SPWRTAHTRNPALMTTVTVNHTARASRRARPASAGSSAPLPTTPAGSSALLPTASARRSALLPTAPAGLPSTFVHDMSVPVAVAAIDSTHHHSAMASAGTSVGAATPTACAKAHIN